MPASALTLVSLSCAFASSQFDDRKPPSLFEFGIADHHFLRAALDARAAPNQRQREQFAHDRRRRAKIGDRLEERRNRQAASLDPRRVVVEVGLLGEQIGAKHVGGRTRHAQDECAKSLAVEFLVLVARQPEHAEGFLRVRRQSAANGGPNPRPRKLGEKPRLPLRGVMRRRPAGGL